MCVRYAWADRTCQEVLLHVEGPQVRESAEFGRQGACAKTPRVAQFVLNSLLCARYACSNRRRTCQGVLPHVEGPEIRELAELGRQAACAFEGFTHSQIRFCVTVET